MQTGWMHEDHQSQREFERIRNKQASAATTATPAATPTQATGTAVSAAAREYVLESPLGSISINTQKQSIRTIWSVERFLTVSVFDKPIPTRIDGVYTTNYRSDTVNHIRFAPGKNVTIHGRYVEKDKVEVKIDSIAPASASLEGSLSTVWVRDLTNATNMYVGWNPLYGFTTALFLGPWGYQAAYNSTTPIANSGYSNIAKDTQWSMGVSIPGSTYAPYTFTGKVDTAGLYWVYATTQGHRWIFDSDWVQFVSQRVHYFLVIKRNGYVESGETYKIYKPLDVLSWDMYFPAGATGSTLVAQMSSVAWSVNGGAMVYLEAGDEICHMLTFHNPTGGYNRTMYGVGYHAVEACLIADGTTLDPATQVDLYPINNGDTAQSYQIMQFANV